MQVQTFYPEVESFTKNKDKFGWVKYWRMTFNSPKFSPMTILHYTVCNYNKVSHAMLLIVLEAMYVIINMG